MKNQECPEQTLPENYRFLQSKIYSDVGIVLQDDRNYLIEGRLAPVTKRLGLETLNELCALLRTNGSKEMDQMVAEAMTTNETYFFREPAHYEAIRTHLLPKLKERSETGRLRFWSAASSTGQEAYSLAMLLREEGMQNWNIEILGTDFCSHVVDRARCALYEQREVNRGLPENLLKKYFLRFDANWQLVESVRRMARFETIDLRKTFSGLGPFDLVFLRNVMIYFDLYTKEKIMREIHNTMVRGSWLLLGGAECTINSDECFERTSIGNTIVYVAR